MPLSLLTLPQKIIRTKIRKKFDLYNFSVGYTECEMLRNIAICPSKHSNVANKAVLIACFLHIKKFDIPIRTKIVQN